MELVTILLDTRF